MSHWLGIQDAARVLGVGVTTAKKHARAADAYKFGKIDVPKVIQYLSRPKDADPLARLRTAKAERQELALAREKKEYIHRDEFFQWFDKVVASLRACQKNMRAKYGEEAVDMLRSAIDAACDEVEREQNEGPK